MTDIRDLVSALADAAPDPAVKLRQGVIQSVQTSSVTLTIGGSSTAVSGIKYLSSYSPVVGDTVWLATDGRDWIIIGKLGPGGGSSTVEAMPAGSIIEWGGSTAPANWLIADGSAVSRTTYASLFAAIGTTFGAGNGTTTFNLPDMRGRVPVGKNGGTFGTLGATGGAETHTLSTAEMPSHTHVQDSHNHTQNSHNHTQDSHNHSQNAHAHNIVIGSTILGYTNGNVGGGSGYGVMYGGNNNFLAASNTATNNATTATNQATTATNNATTATNQNTGGGGAHNNLQPYQVVNFIIKYSNGDTAGDSQLTQRVSALESEPFVRLDRSTAQSIADSSYTAISWNSEIVDTANMWASGTNITVPTAGVYTITAHVSWPNSTTGSRTMRILKNGTSISAEKISPFNGSHWNNLAWTDKFAAGDIITVDVLQNVGAALSLNDASVSVTRLCN